MKNNFSFIAPIIFILICSLFIKFSSSSLYGRTGVSALIPSSAFIPSSALIPSSAFIPSSAPYSPSPTLIPQITIAPTRSPSSTPTPNYKNYLSYDKIYTKSQIEFFKTHDALNYFSSLKFPPLPKPSINRTPVYVFDCVDTPQSPYLQLIPKVAYLDTEVNLIYHTMHLFARDSHGQFPTQAEIQHKSELTKTKYKNSTGGVNQVIIDANGLLRINYYDSVAAYKADTNRLKCMSLASLATAMQFKEIMGLKACIDEMPTSLSSCPTHFLPTVD